MLLCRSQRAHARRNAAELILTLQCWQHLFSVEISENRVGRGHRLLAAHFTDVCSDHRALELAAHLAPRHRISIAHKNYSRDVSKCTLGLSCCGPLSQKAVAAVTTKRHADQSLLHILQSSDPTIPFQNPDQCKVDCEEMLCNSTLRLCSRRLRCCSAFTARSSIAPNAT